MKRLGRLFILVVLGAMTGCDVGLPPVEPSEPVKPTDPVEPVEPVKPTDPTDPVEPTEPTDPVICLNGAPAADNPLLCKRGKIVMNGIDRIPLDMVKLTNQQMQRLFVTVDNDFDHVNGSGAITDWSYVTRTVDDDETDRYFFGGDASNRNRVTRHEDGTITTTTGSIPLTEFLDHRYDAAGFTWLHEQVRNVDTVKIAAYPFGMSFEVDIPDLNKITPFVDRFRGLDDSNMSYLYIFGTGNGGRTTPWFTRIYTPQGQEHVSRAIAGHSLLIVATWDRDERGRYVRQYSADICTGIDDGCIWVQGTLLPLGTGASSAVNHLSAALASVLSVFPDTVYRDLTKLAKACAKKSGEGIEELLRDFGGLGIADFACMDDITAAARTLPAGGSTTVVIDGKTVRVSERTLRVSP